MRYYPTIYTVEDLLARTTEADRAYVAGLVDGEGTICVFQSYTQGSNHFILRTSVYNTYEPVLHWVKGKFGGRVRPVQRKIRVEGHQQGYIWEGGAQQSANMLRVIRRYMIIKATQADLFLELADIHSGKPFGRGKPPEILHRQYEICQEIGKLNRPNKEVVALPSWEDLWDD